MALNLIMLGAPGAGKGTQAERFARAKGIPKISTGDMLRDAVKEGTELGRRAQAIMARGELVSDDVVIDVVRERLTRNDVRAGFILDGFPRTVAQAQALDQLMDGRGRLIVVDIAVPEAELVRRLSSRLVCEDCGTNADSSGVFTPTSCIRCGGRLKQRSDDNEAVIRERLRVYRRNTQPLVDYYGRRPTYCAIDGAQTADRVAADLSTAIEALSAEGGVA